MNLINEIDMGPKLIKNNNFNHNNLSNYSLDFKKINNLFSKIYNNKLIRNIILGNIAKWLPILS